MSVLASRVLLPPHSSPPGTQMLGGGGIWAYASKCSDMPCVERSRERNYLLELSLYIEDFFVLCFYLLLLFLIFIDLCEAKRGASRPLSHTEGQFFLSGDICHCLEIFLIVTTCGE